MPVNSPENKIASFFSLFCNFFQLFSFLHSSQQFLVKRVKIQKKILTFGVYSIDELEAYLDPMFGEGTGQSDRVKQVTF